MALPLKIEHRAGIRAPASAIWEQVVDIEGWPIWNPLYPEAKGVVRIGAELDLTVNLEGQAPRKIKPVIVDWVPNEQLHWRVSMLGGLVKTIRYLEIEELAPGSCIFSNGEIFDGMLGPAIATRLRGPLRAGFQAMGEAVKARAEAAAGAGAG